MIATARGSAPKLEALEKSAKGNLRIAHVDIADSDGVQELREALKDERLDLLFLVAGISGSVPKPLHEVTPDEAARVFSHQRLFPDRRRGSVRGPAQAQRNGRVHVVDARQHRGNDYGTWETYRMSKAALNMGARSFFHRHSGHAVLSIAPGWVRTDMGGPSATFDVETSCRNVANAIEKHGKKPGHRYVNYDGTELPW